MDEDQKKEWQSSYTQKGDNYILQDIKNEELEKLDHDLLTPVVMAYQLGHMTEDAFRDMVKNQAESAVKAQMQSAKQETMSAATEGSQTEASYGTGNSADGTAQM